MNEEREAREKKRAEEMEAVDCVGVAAWMVMVKRVMVSL